MNISAVDANLFRRNNLKIILIVLQDGDGLVDTPEKLEKIINAIKKALAGGAGDEVKAKIEA